VLGVDDTVIGEIDGIVVGVMLDKLTRGMGRDIFRSGFYLSVRDDRMNCNRPGLDCKRVSGSLDMKHEVFWRSTKEDDP